MATKDHLKVLKKGVIKWNEWRRKHPNILPDLGKTDLSKANLTGAKLSGVNLTGAKLSGANLFAADLGGAVLSGADLTEANLIRADLSGAKLNGADLTAASLNGVNLTGADLSRAILRRANVTDVNLTEANLASADLVGANLVRANLVAADLSAADLSGANLSGADLVGTKLNDSKMGYTLLTNIDLASVTGLESVRHNGPSTIGIDTIYRSRAKIPEVFLRGSGAPEEFITYMRSLVTNPIEFYTCFISYSSNDQQFAHRLYADLQAKHVRCWFAPHDVQAGRKLHEQIDQAIRVHEKVLLILSSHSMKSEWVKAEIAKARKREVHENKQVLFPVRLVSFETIRDWECFDADTGKDSAREIREYFIPDFSDWKNHDRYNAAFERLLQDLKAL